MKYLPFSLIILVVGLIYYFNNSNKEHIKEHYIPMDIPLRTPCVEKPLEKNSKLIPNASEVERINLQFEINSWERNIKQWPTPSKYIWKVPGGTLYNVESITLVKASLPKGEYTVNDTNKWMDIQIIGGITLTISVEPGNYNITTYLNALSIAIDLAFGPGSIILTYIALTSKIDITNNLVVPGINILWNSGIHSNMSNFTLLGFKKEDVEILSGNTLVGPNRVSLFGSHYIRITAPEINYPQTDNLIANVAIPGDMQKSIIDYEPLNATPFRYFLPHKPITQLTLHFWNNVPFKKQTLYNFNGLENSLILTFTLFRYKHPQAGPPLRNSL